MSAFVALLGDTLTGKDGEVKTAEALADKTAVALYFSAHWCGPCRGFTPQFAAIYEGALKAKGLEVVFVSSDRDAAAFESYHAEQPWLALPYAARDLKEKLSKKYKVRGIPSLIILDGKTGETITTDGRSCVMEDKDGADFPWRPPTFWEALGDEFLSNSDGETVTVDELRSSAKVIGLYFSAHWCPPCRGFTPELIKSYKEHLKAKGLEIIFVSSDRDAKAFAEYYAEMPWLAIPNGDKRKGQLSKMFDVEGIPTFALVDAATGKTITTDGRGDVGADPTGAEFPWTPKPLNNLSSGKGVSKLNEELCLCVLLDGCDESTIAAAKEVLEPLAAASEAAGSSMGWFYAPTADGPVGQVRKLCHLEQANTPQIMLLDIPDNGGYYVSPATEVTAETLNGFVDAYKAKALDRQQLG